MLLSIGPNLYLEGTEDPICEECSGQEPDWQVLASIVRMAELDMGLSEMLGESWDGLASVEEGF